MEEFATHTFGSVLAKTFPEGENHHKLAGLVCDPGLTSDPRSSSSISRTGADERGGRAVHCRTSMGGGLTEDLGEDVYLVDIWYRS